MGSLWSVEALPLFCHGFVAIHRSSQFGPSSNSSSFPIDDVLPFLQIYYASQSINQTKSGKLIQFQRINTDNYQTKSRKLIPVQEPIKYTSKSIDKTKSRKWIQFQEISKHLKRIKTCWEKAWDKVLSLFIVAASFLCINMVFTSSTMWCLSSQSSTMLLPRLDYKSKHRK